MEFLLYNYVFSHDTIKPRYEGFTEEEWDIILRRNDKDNVSQKKLKDSLMQGIPTHLRGEVWVFLTKSQQLSLQFSGNVYSKLIEQVDTPVRTQILKDLHRTYPEHHLFKEKEGTGQKLSLIHI